LRLNLFHNTGVAFSLGSGDGLGPWITVLALTVVVGLSLGANAGYAINPARDFGPRMFAWLAGWGKLAMPGDYGNINDYFWIPIVGPFIGGLIGAYVYDFTTHDVLVARGAQAPPGVEEQGRTVEDVS